MASEHLLFRRIAPIAPGEVLWCPLLWAQKIFKRFYFNCCTIILHIPISFYSFYSFVLSYIGIPDYIDLLTVVPRTGTDPGERFVFCVKENSPSFHADPLLDRTIVALRSIKMDGWWLKECRMLWELCRVHWRHEKKKKKSIIPSSERYQPEPLISSILEFLLKLSWNYHPCSNHMHRAVIRTQELLHDGEVQAIEAICNNKGALNGWCLICQPRCSMSTDQEHF